MTRGLSEDLKEVFRNYTISTRTGMPVGPSGVIRVTHFLDLLTASHHVDHLAVMSRTLVSHIRDADDLDGCHALVGPKRGNCLLAKAVGDGLGLQTAFARDSMLFGRLVEGPIRSGHKVILVDDVASDGVLLRQSIEGLWRVGIFVAAVWVLVNRKEGDCASELKDLNVEFNWVCEVDDEFLLGL